MNVQSQSAQYLARGLEPGMVITPTPQEMDEGDPIHQTSQHCRTNDVSG